MKFFLRLLFQLVCGVFGGIFGGFVGILFLLSFFGLGAPDGGQYAIFIPSFVMAGFAVWYAKRYSQVFSANAAIFILSLVAIFGVFVFAFWELFNHFVLANLLFPVFWSGLLPAAVFVIIFGLWERFG